MPYKDPEAKRRNARAYYRHIMLDLDRAEKQRQYNRDYYLKHRNRFKAWAKARYLRNGRDVAARWADHLRRYGISPRKYDELYVEQGGKCAVCRMPAQETKSSRLHVDHDHDLGIVRGLLCGTCNSGLGGLKDDPVLLRAAAEYVETVRYRYLGRR